MAERERGEKKRVYVYDSDEGEEVLVVVVDTI
jgi:hypothetical protein